LQNACCRVSALDALTQTKASRSLSCCWEYKWQTEWLRIRSNEHKRLLMHHHGIFYELSPWAFGNRI
jgi:hypothetical protein